MTRDESLLDFKTKFKKEFDIEPPDGIYRLEYNVLDERRWNYIMTDFPERALEIFIKMSHPNCLESIYLQTIHQCQPLPEKHWKIEKRKNIYLLTEETS